MRLSISNIAWDTHEDSEIAALLQRLSIDAIDIAPGKYFTDFTKATDEDISTVKTWWNQHGIEITGMQALLFGTQGLNVFGSEQSQSALLDHLTAVCRIGSKLGATRMVFGSPKNRDRTGLSDEETWRQAVEFFRKVGDIAQHWGVIICLEPNPTCYGANFMTSSVETADIVKRVAHPAIVMQLDTGALAINGESPLVILKDYAKLIGHIHASEPKLIPLGDGGTHHQQMAIAINDFLPNHIVAIEMVATHDEPHATSIERAIKVAIQHYRVMNRESRHEH